MNPPASIFSAKYPSIPLEKTQTKPGSFGGRRERGYTRPYFIRDVRSFSRAGEEEGREEKGNGFYRNNQPGILSKVYSSCILEEI